MYSLEGEELERENNCYTHRSFMKSAEVAGWCFASNLMFSFSPKETKLGQEKGREKCPHLNISAFFLESWFIFAWRLEGASEPWIPFIHLSHEKPWWKGQPESLRCIDTAVDSGPFYSRNNHYAAINPSHTSPPFYKRGHFFWKCLTELLSSSKKFQLSWGLL